jgi:ribosomal protein S12 methylthiotransferase
MKIICNLKIITNNAHISQEIGLGGFDMSYNVGMISLGCDKNRVDSEIMLSILSKNGFNIINNAKEADVIIINTCGFIESAKQESIETILEMAENKESGKCKSIVVTGCMAERYKDELIKEMPEIDAVIGTGSYRDICNIVKETLEGKRGIVKMDNLNYNLDYEDRIITTPSYFAYVKIAEGCDNNCSYCIIPKLRGNFRSRTKESILKEINYLAQNGVKEVILVAQDTSRYGIDLYGKKMITELLSEIETVEGIEWVRLMYSYPEEITDELIEIVKHSKKICNYFDIPMQHISSRVLRLMGRKSTKEKILTLIDKIKCEIPDAAIRTSIIVGFPGETEEDFNELKDFLQNYKLDRVGVFSYSAEEGTSAANMKEQIDTETKETRKNILMQLQSQVSLENNKKLIGKIADVIIEGKSKNGQYYGRTQWDAPEIDQQIYVNCESKGLSKGDVVKVKISKAYTYDLIGDVNYEPGK